MIKKIVGISMLLVLALVGCSGQKSPKTIVGEWECTESFRFSIGNMIYRMEPEAMFYFYEDGSCAFEFAVYSSEQQEWSGRYVSEIYSYEVLKDGGAISIVDGFMGKYTSDIVLSDDSLTLNDKSGVAVEFIRVD